MRKLALFAMAVVFVARAALGAVPGQMNYQGYLTDDAGVPLTGPHDVTFRLYDGTGTEIWDETHGAVQVSEGLFAVLLGGTRALDATIFGADGVELEMEVDGETLNPRVPVVAVGYSIIAALAETVGPDGVDSTAIVDGAVTSADIEDGTIMNADINTSAAIATSKLAGTGASGGDVLTWGGGAWLPASLPLDPGDISSVTAGTGLSGGGTSGAVVLSHAAHAGDVTGADALTVVGIRGRIVSAVVPSDGYVLKWNGTTWSPAADNNSGDITAVNAGTGLAGGATSGAATLNVSFGTTSTTVSAGNHTHSTYVRKSGDTMTGTLTVPTVTFSSAKTRYVSVPGPAFHPAGNNISFTSSSNGITATSGGQSVVFQAPVFLPDGATLVTLYAHFYDIDSAQNIKVDLYQCYNGVNGAVLVATVSSTGDTGFQTRTTSTFSETDVSNSVYGWYLRASWTVPAVVGNLRLRNVWIRYTVTEPLP